MLARLECRQQGSPSGGAAIEPALPAVRSLQPSLSGVLTVSGSWSCLQEVGVGGSVHIARLSGGGAGAGDAGPGEPGRDGCAGGGGYERGLATCCGDGPQPYPAASGCEEPGRGGYEDDFESLSASVADWE